MCHKIKISTNLFPIKDASGLQQLSKFQAQKRLQIEKSAGIRLQEIWLSTWEVLLHLS